MIFTKTNFIIIVSIILFLFSSCKLFEKETKSEEVSGCTNPEATNYNPDATMEDGSCEYPPVYGCTDPEAYNYDSEAGEDDGSCVYNCPKTTFFVLTNSNSSTDWEWSCVYHDSLTDSGSNVTDIEIIDENNIWLCTGSPGRIIYSNDNGDNWDIQYSDPDKTDFFNYIEMFDELNGIAMGDGKTDHPLLITTNDGGITWNEVQVESSPGNGSGDLWRRIDFININIGYWAVSSNVYKTVDGGKNWAQTSYPGQGPYVIKFYDEDFGIVVRNKTVFITEDSGDSFVEVELPDDPGWASDIELFENDPDKIWILGEQKVFYSADKGLTWTVQQSFDSNADNAQDMVISGNGGWIVTLYNNNTCWYSSDVVAGNWEKLVMPVPDYLELGRAIDVGNNGNIVIGGSVN